MNKCVVTLDIGTSKICAACGKILKNKEFEVTNVETVSSGGMKKGIIIDTEAASNSISEVIEKLENRINCKINSVYVNITGGHVDISNKKKSLVIDDTSREVTQKDIKRIINEITDIEVSPDREIIDIVPNEYTLDGYSGIIDPVGMYGRALTLDALLVKGRVTSVKNILRSVEKCGLEVRGFVLGTMADSSLLVTEDEKDTGAILINIGKGITDISYYSNSRLKVYDSLPVGGGHITNDIAIGLDISHREAEKNKRQYELALTSLIKNDQEISFVDVNTNKLKSVQVSSFVEIIEARVIEIFALTRKLLEKRGVNFSKDMKIILTGGGISYIDGACEIAKSVFDKPVRVANYKEYEDDKAEYVTSIGMIKFLSLGLKGKIKESCVNFDEEKENKKDINGKKKKKIFKIFRNIF